MAEKIKIIQRLARIGISIPFFLLVILIWSYLLIKAGKPKVVDPRQSMVGLTTTHCGDKNHILCQSEDMCHWDDSKNTCTNVCELHTMQSSKTKCESNDDCKWTGSPNSGSCSEDPSWHPFEVFCDAQATHVGQITPTTTQVQVEQAQATQPCPDAKTRYYCSSETDKTCASSDKEFDNSASWCDVSNLHSLPASSGSSTTSKSITPREHAVKTHCCKDKVYESNINYVGMIVYMLLTLPFVYFLIEKIIQVFINYTDDGLVQDDQFEFLGKFVSHNGGKILGICIFAYYIILPIFRFIFVSYKCEDIVSGSAENCGKPCTTTDDCASVTGNGCILCVNNVCENPIFTDNTQGASSSNIQVSVCSVKSILKDLSDNDIDELYTKHVSSPSSSASRTAKITAINKALKTPEKEKKATSEFYKFIPRQNLAISDAVMPFNVRIPNPTDSGTPISGFSYILNNYIQMEEYSADGVPQDGDSKSSADICTMYISEIDCNKNHNCKYVNGACQSNTCTNEGKRYSLPIMLGINTTQQVNSIPLHNQVVRGGSTSDNTYPCNTVVIDNLQKIAAKADLSNNNNLINDGVKDWINEFELKRFECADKNGQCYMDDYICKTAEGVPIPLKYTAVPAKGRYTVGEISDKGCSSAMYPCIKKGTGPNPCTALIYNNGYLLEGTGKDHGGTCQSLVWTKNGWRLATAGDQPDVIRDMCVPNSITPGTSSNYTTIAEATAGDYVSTLAPGVDIDTNCKSVKRMPYSSVTTDKLSTANPYYRWSPVDASDHTSCSKWLSSHACSKGKVNNHLGTYTTNENPQDKCCIDGVASTDNSLYVTASSGTAASLKPLGSGSPITPTNLN